MLVSLTCAERSRAPYQLLFLWTNPLGFVADERCKRPNAHEVSCGPVHARDHQPCYTNLVQLLPSCPASPTVSPLRYAAGLCRIDDEPDSSRHQRHHSAARLQRRLPRSPLPPAPIPCSRVRLSFRSARNVLARGDEAHHHLAITWRLRRARREPSPDSEAVRPLAGCYRAGTAAAREASMLRASVNI